MKRRLAAMAVIGVLVCVGVFAHHYLTEPPNTCNGFGCDNGTGGCSCRVGSSGTCTGINPNENGYAGGWYTTCGSGDPFARVYCDDGEVLSCTGEFEAQADHTGIVCKDTGGQWADSSYCDV